MQVQDLFDDFNLINHKQSWVSAFNLFNMICNHPQVNMGGLVISFLGRLLVVHGLFFYWTIE
jgi:hypothetical protein